MARRMRYKGRPPWGSPRPSDAEIALELVMGKAKPTNSPFSWSDLVRAGEERIGERPYVKLRVSRGLRALQKTGQVEKVGKLYRLADDGEKALAYLDLLGESISLMKQALESLNDESRRGLVGAAWEFLRDRFKDAAL